VPDTGTSTLSTEQVAQVLKLVGIAGSVELKVSVPDAGGIDVTGEQQTKTSKALEFFASELPGGN
jgi:hypothetical protein